MTQAASHLLMTIVAHQYEKVLIIRVPIKLSPYLFPSWQLVRVHVSLGIRFIGRPCPGPDTGFLPSPDLDHTA